MSARGKLERDLARDAVAAMFAVRQPAPRVRHDYRTIRTLLRRGYSSLRIAYLIDCSLGTVERVARMRACAYCGYPCRGVACAAHYDLLALDPAAPKEATDG